MTEPATASEARSVLNERVASKEFAARIFAGDPEARRELDALHAKIHSGDTDVMSDVLAGKPVQGTGMQMAAVAVDHFRSLGIPNAEIGELLSDKPVTKEAYEKAANEKRVALGTKDFADKYMAGSVPERQQLAKWDAILTRGVASGEAA